MFDRCKTDVIRIITGAITAVIVCLLNPALAEEPIAKVEEPQRFALLIGNSAYDETQGSLPGLGSPCHMDDPSLDSDVNSMQNALIAANWGKDNIEIKCDLKTADLLIAVKGFIKKVAQTPRAFGILYYSGHGAQISGRNYIFGTDARIDEKAEVSAYFQNFNAPLFGTDAVQLDKEFSDLFPVWAKGVLVILDACRDNPLIDRLKERGIATIKYPAPSTDVQGLVFAFATKAGAKAPDGGIGKLSPYTKVLTEYLYKSHDNPSEGVLEMLSSVNTETYRRSHGTQDPGYSGEFRRPPYFCLAGCPSATSYWKTYNQEFFSEEILDLTFDHFDVQKFAVQPTLIGDTITIEPYGGKYVYAAATKLEDISTDVDALENKLQITSVQQSARFDIFWCDGDELSSVREAAATAFRNALLKIQRKPNFISGYAVGDTRLRPLPPTLNAAIDYRLRKDVIFYDIGSKDEKLMAKMAGKLANSQLLLQPRPGNSPDYISVYFCKGYNLKITPASLFVQVASAGQLTKARSIVGSIGQQMLGIDVEANIDVEPSSPKKTEVRFYSREQKSNAQEIAMRVSSELGYKVNARYMTGYQGSLNFRPTVELWFGITDIF